MHIEDDNKALLQRMNHANCWRHYKKIKPVWVKKLDNEETVHTNEGPISYRAGDYLCKGPAGDVWGQQTATLFAKYEPAPEHHSDPEGWQKFLPKPDDAGVMATPVDSDFAVKHPVWGIFKGCRGDYLVKNREDEENPFPDDIWVVKKEIFESTYKRIGQGKD
jgi:hypothetical protein